MWKIYVHILTLFCQNLSTSGGLCPLTPQQGLITSITSGFFCMDIRKFFMPYDGSDVKPTHQGIALRLREWGEMRRIIDAINDAYPPLGTALQYYLAHDHQNQIGALQCRECYPFTTVAF